MLQGVDCVAAMRENTVGICVLFAAIASFISLCILLARDIRRPRTARDIANDMETADPTIQDSLNCSVEIEQRSTPEKNDVEKLLLDRTERFFEEHSAELVSPQQRRYRGGLLLTLASVAAIALIGEFTPVGQKASCRLEEWLTGTPTGIVLIAPTERSVIIHSDVRVQVSVKRGPTSATIHTRDANGETLSVPMHPVDNEPGVSSLTLYDLTVPTRFKITTDILETPWFELTTYPEPKFTAITLQTVPQPYTGAEPQHFNEFQDISIIDGDAVQLALNLENGSAVSLKSSDETLSLQPKGTNQFTLDFLPKTTASWEVVVSDIAGHPHTTANFTINVTPDQPPVIERIEPPEDAKLKPRDSLHFAATAADDFGLTEFELQYRVIGQQKQSRDLMDAYDKNTREATADFLWDIASMNLPPGSVIACMLVASDNRRPTPNTTRCDAFYITVVPDPEEISSEGDSTSEDFKIDISDLIAESKRLLRATWDLRSLDNVPQTMLDETLTALKDLRIETLRRMAEIQKLAHAPAVPEPFHSLFKACASELDDAVSALQSLGADDSITHQENALAALVRIESELLKNKAKSDKAKSNGNQGDEQKSEQKEGESSEDGEEKSSEEARKLEESIRKLQEIIAKQDALNTASRRADSPAAMLAETQQAIRADAGTLQQTLNNTETAAAARGHLQAARNEMGGAVTAFRKSDSQTAAIHGTRAMQQLIETLDQLQKALRQLDANQANALAKETERLAQEQMEAARHSEELKQQDSQEERTKARKHQDELRSQTEKLQRKMEALADALEGTLPETARQLRDHSRIITKDDILGRQKKASNALLYRRFDRASDEQQKASEALGKLAGALAETVRTMPQYTPEQLRQMMKQLKDAADATRQAMNDENAERATQKLQRQRQRTEQLLEELGRTLKDQRISEAAKAMADGIGDSENANMAQSLLDTLQKAQEITAEYLQRLERGQSIQLHREFVTPPDKYRRLVEEYFKGLGR